MQSRINCIAAGITDGTDGKADTLIGIINGKQFIQFRLAQQTRINFCNVILRGVALQNLQIIRIKTVVNNGRNGV